MEESESLDSKYIENAKIRLCRLHFGNDPGVAKIKENESFCEFKLPFFRARATVEFPPIPKDTNYELGWILVYTDFVHTCTYGNEGVSSMEIPQLIDNQGKMINASEGEPWLETENSFAEINQETSDFQTVTVDFEYQCKQQAEWSIPYKPLKFGSALTFVHMHHKFRTFLALRDLEENTTDIITEIKWTNELAIDVDPQKTVGNRAVFIGPCVQKKAVIVSNEKTPKIEEHVFRDYSIHNLTAHIWRPKDAEPRTIMEQEAEEINMKKYCKDTIGYSKVLLKMNLTKFLLEQDTKEQNNED